tara:strand:- start:209283 stop:210065 length:783 start_codon:yes stop_codon:yes gene_type:complete
VSDTNEGYAKKAAFYDRVLTVYGRKPALEALRDTSLDCHALHLAHSNREASIITDLRSLARQRNVPVQEHSREALARISRNGKQDQGVALDILCPGFKPLDTYLDDLGSSRPQRLLALDGITNPQNLGMLIRSSVAGGIDGILWSKKGNAGLGPLVIKASTGTLYRAPLLTCQNLAEALPRLQSQGAQICTLAANASESLFDYRPATHCVYVLGNETDGVSAAVRQLADRELSIPMQGQVESLNVAVTASLIAYAAYLAR